MSYSGHSSPLQCAPRMPCLDPRAGGEEAGWALMPKPLLAALILTRATSVHVSGRDLAHHQPPVSWNGFTHRTDTLLTWMLWPRSSTSWCLPKTHVAPGPWVTYKTVLARSLPHQSQSHTYFLPVKAQAGGLHF